MAHSPEQPTVAGGGQTSSFVAWASGLDGQALSIWREAMANLRQLHGDVWNGVAFFLTVNAVLVAALATLYGTWLARGPQAPSGPLWIMLFLGLVGLLFTWQAMLILSRHREYYLGMQLLKSLIEKDLGFYDILLGQTDLSFPSRVPAEHLPQLFADPIEWLHDRKWQLTSITARLHLVYWGVVVIHLAIMVLAIVGLLT
jgi:hypothetical protein